MYVIINYLDDMLFFIGIALSIDRHLATISLEEERI